MLKEVKRIKLGIHAYRRIMKRVLERDDWRCQKCGSLENLQIHHQKKRTQQGDDALDNLMTFCADCHMAEHGQLGFERKALQSIAGNDWSIPCPAWACLLGTSAADSTQGTDCS